MKAGTNVGTNVGTEPEVVVAAVVNGSTVEATTVGAATVAEEATTGGVSTEVVGAVGMSPITSRLYR